MDAMDRGWTRDGRAMDATLLLNNSGRLSGLFDSTTQNVQLVYISPTSIG
jgi:hypothetical protein